MTTGRAFPSALLVLLRPRQWYKNVIVLVPLVFSGNLGTWSLWPAALVTLVAFCALSSAVYAANDVVDANRDREHPRKRHRPVASGVVAPATAIGLAFLLAAAGLAALVLVNPLTLAMGLLYLLLQALYNGLLKHLVLWDALGVSFGFVVRALAGTTALDVGPPTEWLIVCTFLFALYLALAKRSAELTLLQRDQQGAGHRPVLAQYRPAFLDQAMQTSATLLLAAYSLYTFFGTTSWMMFTLPFAFYGVFRLSWLINEERVADEAEAILRDRPLQVNAFLWLLTAAAVLSGAPQAVVGWIEGLA